MNKTDEALAKILTSLADKFGTTVDHLYAIMIKQAFIDGIECILSIIILVPLAVFLCLKMYKDRVAYWKQEDKRQKELREKKRSFISKCFCQHKIHDHTSHRRNG